MERIKQAIEEANTPRTDKLRKRSVEAVHARHYSTDRKIQFSVSWNAVKYLTGAVLIFLAGWLWLRLDFMNQIEQITSQFINDSIRTARADIRRRSEDEEKYRQALQVNLAHCLEVAVKDRDKYIGVVAEQVRVKNENAKASSHEKSGHEKFIIPATAMTDANRIMETAKAECQQIYESQQRK
jgi:hypothetical protein